MSIFFPNAVELICQSIFQTPFFKENRYLYAPSRMNIASLEKCHFMVLLV